jgi:CheY-like chemotaxis protein
VIQVLVDADNVSAPRISALLRALPLDEVEIVVAGSPRALAAVRWPAQARTTEVEGWQQADLVLMDAYRPGSEGLVLVTGDGDFGLLATTHTGPVLVISDRPATRLRSAGTVVDPVHDGLNAVRSWFDAVTDSTMG